VTVSDLHIFYPETGVTRFKLVLERKESKQHVTLHVYL